MRVSRVSSIFQAVWNFYHTLAFLHFELIAILYNFVFHFILNEFAHFFLLLIYSKVMDDIRDGLRYLFQTRNPITFCGTGSGNAGMEICLGNLIEPGDIVVVFVSGAFGWRAVEMSKRYGADVRIVESKLGTAFKYEQIRAHIELHQPKIMFICHGDSSSGVLQSLNNVGELCQR